MTEMREPNGSQNSDAAPETGLADIVSFADRMHFPTAPQAKAEYEALLNIAAEAKQLADDLDEPRTDEIHRLCEWLDEVRHGRF